MIKNSISAYYAAIEMHNKPNISYRYETVSMLITNAWELILKAYIKKYQKNKSIYTKDGHTIGLDKAISYVEEDLNHKVKNSFTPIKENLLQIEKYRNNTVHFYCDEIEPYIFMLIARAALNYVDFVKQYFGKDVMADQGLFILPLGFKLPFKPEDYLSNNITKYASSKEAQNFIDGIVETIKKLDADGIDDSIVLGFDVYFESVKKQTNSDIIVAIDNSNDTSIKLSKSTTVNISENASQKISIDDEEFRRIWKYTHADLVNWCKHNIKDFKQNKLFNDAKKAISNDKNCVYEKRLDSRNSKSASKKYYSDLALQKIKEFYERKD